MVEVEDGHQQPILLSYLIISEQRLRMNVTVNNRDVRVIIAFKSEPPNCCYSEFDTLAIFISESSFA